MPGVPLYMGGLLGNLIWSQSRSVKTADSPALRKTPGDGDVPDSIMQAKTGWPSSRLSQSESGFSEKNRVKWNVSNSSSHSIHPLLA